MKLHAANSSAGSAASGRLGAVTVADLATWGVDHLAYVRPVDVDGEAAFAIHAADGRPLAVVRDRDTAFAAALQNDLEPLFVH